MELIPILSMIILVSTISTFALAVGSYAMYKVREKRAVQQKAQSTTYEAEVVTSTETKEVQPTPVVVKLTQPQISKAFEQVNIEKEEQESTKKQTEQIKEKQENKGDVLRWR